MFSNRSALFAKNGNDPKNPRKNIVSVQPVLPPTETKSVREDRKKVFNDDLALEVRQRSLNHWLSMTRRDYR